MYAKLKFKLPCPKIGPAVAIYYDRAAEMSPEQREELGTVAKARIKSAYSWEFIASEYKGGWIQ